jgi:hypothetical protein
MASRLPWVGRILRLLVSNFRKVPSRLTFGSPAGRTNEAGRSPSQRCYSRSFFSQRGRSPDGETKVADRALVIIPTYNESTNLPLIVPQVLAQDERIEVLVVDDNSPDGTGELADGLAEKDPRVHVLHRPGKQGLGRAYIAGGEL